LFDSASFFSLLSVLRPFTSVMALSDRTIRGDPNALTISNVQRQLTQVTDSGHRGITQGVELAKTAQAFHLRDLVLVEHERCSTCNSQTNLRRSTGALHAVV